MTDSFVLYCQVISIINIQITELTGLSSHSSFISTPLFAIELHHIPATYDSSSIKSISGSTPVVFIVEFSPLECSLYR